MRTTFFVAAIGVALFAVGMAAPSASAAVSQSLIDQADLFYRRGVEYADKGEHEKAIREFGDGLSLNPDDPKIHFKLGVSYYGMLDYKKAIRSYREALRLRPSYHEVRYFLATALADKGDQKEAIEEFQKAHEADPKDLDVTFDYGYALYKAEDYAKATDLFEQFLREVPTSYSERISWTQEMLREIKRKRFSS